jgi:signal transduction histidine kinase
MRPRHLRDIDRRALVVVPVRKHGLNAKRLELHEVVVAAEHIASTSAATNCARHSKAQRRKFALLHGQHLSNSAKFTGRGGDISVRTHAENSTAFIQVATPALE